MVADGCSARCASALSVDTGSVPFPSVRRDSLRGKDARESGVKELCLIAQDTSAYGLDLYGERKLSGLLHVLSDVEGVDWLRVLYAQPQHITDDLIKVMAEAGKVRSYWTCRSNMRAIQL